MTPEQIAAIAARNEARTQGKWTHTTYLSGTQNVEFPGSRGVAVVNSVNDHDNKPIANSVLCLPPTHMAVSQRLEDYGRDDDHQRFHNGQFIAHASEDIPSLLAEVARLTDALAEAEKRSDRAVAYIKAIAAVAKLQPTAQECGIKPDLILPETWEDLGRFLGYLSETVRVMVRP